MSSTTIPMSTSYKSVFVLSILMIFLFLIGVVESGSKSVGIGSWYWGYTAWKMYKRDNDSLVSLQKFILWLQVVLFPVALAVLLYSDSDVRRFVDVTPLFLIITATLNMGVTYFLYRFFKGQQHIDLTSASIVGNSSIEDPLPESKTSSWLDRSVPKNEDEIFEYIANELETNSTNKSLWYKLFAECDGDETRTKVAYINARSSQLSSEIAKAQEDLQEQERRIEMVRRAGNPVIQDKVLFRDDEVAPVPSLTVPKVHTFYKFLGILLILGGVGVVLDQGNIGKYKT